MKIAVFTINDCFNYGNRLQNYALQIFLEGLSPSIKVESIWYRRNNYRHVKANLFVRINKFVKKINREFSNKYFNKYIREYNIKKFSDNHINTKYDYCVQKSLGTKYDYFIVGSDQVWNPFYLNCREVAFLEFTLPNKRISYSASFGVGEIPKDKQAFFKKGLERMEHISVREHAGAEIVKNLTGREVPVLLDPTLTLTSEQLGKIIQKPLWYRDEEYLLVFFLSKLPDLVRVEVERIAKENNLKIVDLMDETNIDYYTSTPEEFLYLIKNARLVYTDSFHCTVFCILFRTAFVNCSRENIGMNMDSRMDTLLGMFNLQNRKAEKNNNYIIVNPLVIDYPEVEKILEPERKKAQQYLLNALGISVQE